jgi:phosphatidylglycerophosphate synthase
MSSPVAPTATRLGWSVDDFQATRGFRFPEVDLRLAALTLGRLSLVPVIIVSFMKVPALTMSAIVMFVLADIFDGVFARDRGADGPSRRAMDSVVDRIAIDAGMVGAYLADLLPGFLLLALLTRDAYCAVICARMMYRRKVAIKADWMYRGLNLSIAIGAIAAPFLPGGLWVSLAGVLLLLSVAVAADLTRSVRLVEGSSPDVRDTVLPAGALRRGSLG